MLLRLMERFPVIVTLGALLIGYVAGQMAVSDPALLGWRETHSPAIGLVVPFVYGALVFLLARALKAFAARRRRR
jgi:predicted tellurium resistance membrane protein TerC